MIPQTQAKKDLLKNLELVRKSQPLYKQDLHQKKPENKWAKKPQSLTENDPNKDVNLLESINEYMRHIQHPQKLNISVNSTEVVELNKLEAEHLVNKGSFEDFREIEKNLGQSSQGEHLKIITSSLQSNFSSKRSKYPSISLRYLQVNWIDSGQVNNTWDDIHGTTQEEIQSQEVLPNKRGRQRTHHATKSSELDLENKFFLGKRLNFFYDNF